MSKTLEEKIDALTNEVSELKNIVLEIRENSNYWIEEKANQEREEKRTGMVGQPGFPKVTGRMY